MINAEEQDYNTMVSQMQRIIDNLQSSERVRAVMNIDQFLNPSIEQIVDDDNDLVDFLAECYGTGKERAYETDEKVDSMPTISYIEVMKALNLLRSYEEQQDVGDRKLIEHLNDAEKRLQGRHVASSKQQEITRYFQ